MTTTNIHTIEEESALAEEIIATVIGHIGRGARIAYDADGDAAGIVYYADETAMYYGADLDDLRRYITTVRETQDTDAYSVWCGSTSPTGESKTEAGCLAQMGWSA